ncbi:MAG: site-specific DNA-methyltransferase [Gemmataceae bacterium]|nr:site-specific DNA-methyltransferase [Gemmataceae bacterium]
MPEVTPQQVQRQPVDRTSAPVLAEQVAKLRQCFPEAVSEGKIDFDKLRVALGDSVETRTERFNFTWAGKQDAIALLQTPSRATLIPCPEESVHFDTTQHLFIEGDNLEVLKLLFKPYFGRVKLIYIDPPYNTGQDFVYPDDYADPLRTYLRMTGQEDEEGNRLTSNPETSGRYHSTWLSMLYPRLFLARQLLADDGVIFVSIDDHEVQHLRMLMNEVFGEENFVAQLIWKSRQFTDARAISGVSTDHEYVLVYAKDEGFRFRGSERDESKYSNPDNDSRGLWMSRSILGLATAEQRPNLHYDIADPKTKHSFAPPANTGWRYAKTRMKELIDSGCILFPPHADGRPREKKFRKDLANEFVSFPSIITDIFTANGTAEIREMFGFQAFDFPKPSQLIRRLIEQVTDKGDIVLDLFAGSCTTAQAVLELNHDDGGSRRFMMVQLPEPTGKEEYSTIAELGKERIRRSIAKIREASRDTLDLATGGQPEDLGFKVFKLAASNYEPWTGVAERTPEAYIQQMGLYHDPLVKGWEATNVIWEVAIKEGYGLTTQIDKQDAGQGNTIYRVTDPDKNQSFRICLDDEIKPGLTQTLALTKDDLFICRDKALDDTAAANLALQCRLKTI